MHENNIQQLPIEMFKVNHGLASKVFGSMFIIGNNENRWF